VSLIGASSSRGVLAKTSGSVLPLSRHRRGKLYRSVSSRISSPNKKYRHLAWIRTSRKRSLESSDGKWSPADEDGDDGDDDVSESDISGALSGLGYLSHHHQLVLGQESPRVRRFPQ